MKNLKLETLKKIDEEDMKILYSVMNKFTEKERLIFVQYFISGLDNNLSPLKNIENKLNGIFPTATIYNFLTDEHEPFQELLVKDLFDNETNNIIIHYWELVNSDVVLKTLDRSAFLYNTTSVAMGVRSYFDEELGRGETKKISIL